MKGVFVTGTGTGVGKTFVTRGLARALSDAGRSVAAVKPVETGCSPLPSDAFALAAACRRPDLVDVHGFYRATAPLAPYAAFLEGAPAPPTVSALAACVRALAKDVDLVIVEGAGGLLVPLSRTETIAELAAALALPLFIVARDELGVVSHVLTAVEAARARHMEIGAIVLRQLPTADRDPSSRTNARILAESTGVAVALFGAGASDDDDALAKRAAAAGLPELATANPEKPAVPEFPR